MKLNKNKKSIFFILIIVIFVFVNIIIFKNYLKNKNKYTYSISIYDGLYEENAEKIDVFYMSIDNDIKVYDIIYNQNTDKYEFIISLYTYRQNLMPIQTKRMSKYLLEVIEYKIEENELFIIFKNSSINEKELIKIMECLTNSMYLQNIKKIIIEINNNELSFWRNNEGNISYTKQKQSNRD